MAVPAVGLIELFLHLWQTTAGVIPPGDWRAAREAVRKQVQPSDLVVFAPSWADPLGREYLGDDLATMEREARPDESRFPRAIEVSIRGKHRAELAHWRAVAKEKVGAVTITTLENPAPVKLLDDLLAHAALRTMTVARVENDREVACSWAHGAAQAGSLGAGPATPADKFTCAGGSVVGISVIFAMDNTPRRCLLATTPGGGSVLRITFTDVLFGRVLHGHQALPQFAERDKKGPPVTILFRTAETSLGNLVHHDGDGWKAFELDTHELEGKRGDLVAEISSSAAGRQFCFEADTR